MFKPKVAIRKGLYEELKAIAKAKGYSSVDEFVIHLLEKAAAEGRETVDEERVRQTLKGLGYLE